MATISKMETVQTEKKDQDVCPGHLEVERRIQNFCCGGNASKSRVAKKVLQTFGLLN